MTCCTAHLCSLRSHLNQYLFPSLSDIPTSTYTILVFPLLPTACMFCTLPSQRRNSYQQFLPSTLNLLLLPPLSLTQFGCCPFGCLSILFLHPSSTPSEDYPTCSSSSSLHPSSPTFNLHPSIRPPYLHPVHSRPLLHRIRSTSHGSPRKHTKAPPAQFMQAQKGPSTARTEASSPSRLTFVQAHKKAPARNLFHDILNFRTQALLLRRNRRRRRGGATSCFVSFSFLPSAATAWGAVRTNETNNQFTAKVPSPKYSSP
jgi:hypothetical protein